MTTQHPIPACLVLALMSAILVAAQQNRTPDTAPASKPAAQKHVVLPQDEGQRTFEQHCSRCHAAPEGFSPRISGTIVRHMRVRASLSQHEEEQLLRFFNP